jgi:hypothetical protein
MTMTIMIDTFSISRLLRKAGIYTCSRIPVGRLTANHQGLCQK